MSTGAKQVMIDHWQYLYKRALASVSSKNMSQRVASAEKAIIMKLGHLRADSGNLQNCWLSWTPLRLYERSSVDGSCRGWDRSLAIRRITWTPVRNAHNRAYVVYRRNSHMVVALSQY